MIYAVAAEKLADSDGRGWKQLLGCRNARALPGYWHMSGSDDLQLLEFRRELAGDRDASARLGIAPGLISAMIQTPADQPRNQANALILLLLNGLSGQMEPVLLANPLFFPRRPHVIGDILLSHGLVEEALLLEEDSASSVLGRLLFELVPSHRFLCAAVKADCPGEELYPALHRLLDLARRQAELGAEV